MKLEIIVPILAVAALIGFFLLLKSGILKRKPKNPIVGEIDWRRVSPGDVPISQVFQGTTPLGLAVFSETKPEASFYLDLDRAYQEEYDRAWAAGYRRLPAPSKFEIYTPKVACELSPVSRTPSFKLRYGDDYDGLIYDYHYSKKYNPPRMENGLEYHSEKDGVAVGFAAEMVIGLSTPGSQPQIDRFIVCPGVAYEGAKNGFQHIFIAHNNGAHYTNTAGGGHSHPLEYLLPPVGLSGQLVAIYNGSVICETI